MFIAFSQDHKLLVLCLLAPNRKNLYRKLRDGEQRGGRVAHETAELIYKGKISMLEFALNIAAL